MADLLVRERRSHVLLDASTTAILDPETTVGECWVRRFLQRYPHLKSRYSRKYDYQRALCEDSEKILAWFGRVQKTIEENGVLECDIYNFDETGFQMGIASTAKVVTRSDRKNRPVVVQPGNREWVTVIECINSIGWNLDPIIILEGKVHISTWYVGSTLPKTWRIGISDNGWTTDALIFEWLQKVFEPQTRSRTTGRYRLLILDGHGSHITPAFDKFCKEHSILTEYMPSHSSHPHQPLDVSCFSVIKQAYGNLVKAEIGLGVHYIDKPLFLELIQDARKKAFTSKNIKSGFRATGLIPLDPVRYSNGFKSGYVRQAHQLLSNQLLNNPQVQHYLSKHHRISLSLAVPRENFKKRQVQQIERFGKLSKVARWQCITLFFCARRTLDFGMKPLDERENKHGDEHLFKLAGLWKSGRESLLARHDRHDRHAEEIKEKRLRM